VLAALYAALLLAAFVSGRDELAGLAAFVLLGLLLGAGLRRGRALAWLAWLGSAALLLWLGRHGRMRLALDALPVLVNALLAGVFARTLRAGSEPLIARVICVLEGAERLALPRVAPYARALTAAWALLLGAQALALAIVLACRVPDGALAAFGVVPPLALEGAAWRAYLQWGGYALVPAFLVLEYAFRRVWLRALPHAPLPLFLARLAQRWPALLHSLAHDAPRARA
jgi:uncharacterized membrane protein